MKSKEFIRIRRILGKTQKQLAQLLDITPKAVQSYEYGWRNVPVHVERLILYLMVQKYTDGNEVPVCWEVLDCPEETRVKCPAWEFKTPNLCWFINGTVSCGTAEKSWQEKMKRCRQCKIFRDQLPSLYQAGSRTKE